MIVYLSNRNESLCIPISLTICLCLEIGNDLVNKFARLLEDLICFTSILDFSSSCVEKSEPITFL